jgi:hypothetical protein
MKKSITNRAVLWVAKDAKNRSDAEAARRFGLKSASSLTHFRQSNKINRDGERNEN